MWASAVPVKRVTTREYPYKLDAKCCVFTAYKGGRGFEEAVRWSLIN